MSFYLVDGEKLWPTTEGAFNIRDKLDVGTYSVSKSPRGFFLSPITDFKIEGKVYGNSTARADRILNTFQSRPNTTGVLLAGEKGSGKTLLAKQVSAKAAELGIPTLVINTPFCGDDFNQFIQTIDEPCVIIFDEFEKVFDEEAQEAILTLLDGVYPTKKLFVLTCNNKYRVNAHMQNRPGRIFYSIDFAGLDIAFVREYCLDNLNDKSHIETVCRLVPLYMAFNFDMLKALVEEMNRYNESPTQALDMLNAKPFTERDETKYDVKVFKEGEEVDTELLYTEHIYGNPVAKSEIGIQMYMSKEELEDDHSDTTSFSLTPDRLKKVDPENGCYTYVLENDKMVIQLVRQKKDSYDWRTAF